MRPAWARVSEAGAFKMRWLGKRIGVSVCRRLQRSSTLSRPPDHYSRVEKQSYFARRQYADTLAQPAAHFERNDVTIICRRYTNPQESGAIMNRCLSSEALCPRVSPRSDEA